VELSGLHLLLTYQCNFECDHCFVWGGPKQSGTMRLSDVREIMRQAEALGTVESVYFEGGEPFLYYPILVKSVEEAAAQGFRVGVVTNSYWATELEDALTWLRPFKGLIQDLSVSSDLHHWDEMLSRQVRTAHHAAEELGIPIGTISVAQPNEDDAALASLMFRGRAVEKLASSVPQHPWHTFVECPYEDLRDPGRVHIDPLGNVHLCQGMSLGNLFRTPLTKICSTYEPDAHPIVGPLLQGGPAELGRRYRVPLKEAYADACHLCYEMRLALRPRFPEILTPDQVYGLLGE
jgi:organic radical activating enzyme